MTWLIIFGLIFLGLLLVFLEVAFLPGLIVGIAGGALTISGVVMAYSEFGMTIGNYTLLGSFVANIILIFAGLKFVAKKFSLKDNIGSKVNLLDNDKVRAGDTGTSFTALRPNGKALINGERMEVYSTGEYIDKDAKIVVAKIAEDKIFVRQHNVQ